MRRAHKRRKETTNEHRTDVKVCKHCGIDRGRNLLSVYDRRLSARRRESPIHSVRLRRRLFVVHFGTFVLPDGVCGYDLVLALSASHVYAPNPRINRRKERKNAGFLADFGSGGVLFLHVVYNGSSGRRRGVGVHIDVKRKQFKKLRLWHLPDGIGKRDNGYSVKAEHPLFFSYYI